MSQPEPLRGYAAFDRVFHSGQRIGGSLLTCIYLIEQAGRPVLRVGYAVSSRRFNAVRRNRLRRLMREAVRAESALLCEALAQHSVSASIVLAYRARADVDVRRLPLGSVRRDVGDLFRRLARRLMELAHA